MKRRNLSVRKSGAIVLTMAMLAAATPASVFADELPAEADVVETEEGSIEEAAEEGLVEDAVMESEEDAPVEDAVVEAEEDTPDEDSVLSAEGDDTVTGIAIDETNFPDEYLRNYVSKKRYDANQDGYLSESECLSVEYLSLGNYSTNNGVTSLKGIEYFTELTYLNCMNNKLTELDISSNTKLTSIYFDENSVTSVDFSKNPELTTIYCYGNKLTSVDVSNNTKLEALTISGNQVGSLDLSHNPDLKNLSVSSCGLSSLDLSGLTKLETLICESNLFTSLDLSNNPSITSLAVSFNDLTTLDVSNLTGLTFFRGRMNHFTSLDLSNNPSISTLEADKNSYPITLSKKGTYDLTQLPGGFDTAKASGWTGGSVSGTTLVVDGDAEEVTYSYDCGNDNTIEFKLAVTWPEVRDIRSAKISIPASSYTYTGEEFTPKPTVVWNKVTLTEGEDYTISYADNKDVGKGTVTITGCGNYDGSLAETFKIVPAKTTLSSVANMASGIKVKWTKNSQVTGYSIYRSKNGGSYSKVKTITSASTVSWTDTGAVTNGAKYQYKITGYKTVDGTNYTSAYSSVKTIYRLTRPMISSLTNLSGKKMEVNWGKNAKTTGYQIQYSTSSSFSSAKSKKVTSYATISKTIGSLTKGKTYYVRVRAYKTVSGTNYYSEWSTKKKVKITK